MTRAIPYMQIRGGSSKGLYFKASDLPSDEETRNRWLIKAMEGTSTGDPRQIDGLGGATSLTSKVGIVSLSAGDDSDLDYFFVQVVVGKGVVSTTQTCGNILAGVLPFAIESGMIEARGSTTTARIRIVNTGGMCDVSVLTPNGNVQYEGDARVDGVPGTAAPVVCNYLDTVGSTCGSLFPTGQEIDVADGIPITCIDNGMPVVLVSASEFGITGNEPIELLEGNVALKEKIEQIRVKAGAMMHLEDVTKKTIPKICLISTPVQGGTLSTRMFIPHRVHEAIGVLAAVSVATACITPGTVAKGVANAEKIIKSTAAPAVVTLEIEHPSGSMSVVLEYSYQDNQLAVIKSGVVRTARLLSRGEVFIAGES